MAFECLRYFNHTDPENRFTPVEGMDALDNQYFQRLNDRIRFFCPTKGENLQPTANTLYGRSELREWDTDNGVKAAVMLTDYAYNFMAVRQCIGALGPDGRAICLQIHGSSNSPLSKLQWRRNTDGVTANLYFQRRPIFSGTEEKEVLVRNMPMDRVYDLALGFTPTTLFVYFNWNTTAPVYREIAIDGESYDTDPQYFKSGIYCQTNILVPYEDQQPGYGFIDIFDMALHHGEVVALPDFDQTTAWRVGDNAGDLNRLTRLFPELLHASVRDTLQYAMSGIDEGDLTKAETGLAAIEAQIEDTLRKLPILQRWVAEERALTLIR